MKRMTPVTDPKEIEDLEKGKEDIGTPFFQSPNGHPWVDADELRDWREGRK